MPRLSLRSNVPPPSASSTRAADTNAPFVRPALINGAAGVVAFDGKQPFALLAFTVRGGRAVAIDVFNDRELVPTLVRRAR